MKQIDIINKKRFGFLEVLSVEKYSKIKCKCHACEKIYLKDSSSFHNNTYSCGCVRKKHTPRPPKHNIIGQIFGYLEVVGMKQKKYQYMAVCKCLLCGKEITTRPYTLIIGRAKSCGCRRDHYAKMSGKFHKQFTGYEEIRGNYWKQVQRRAARRNIEFNLDIKDAWELYQKQNGRCALTNGEIGFYSGKRHTASLDRIDISKGYEISNVQWVHKDVNLMRNIYSLDYFVGVCKSVAKNFPGDAIQCPNYWVSKHNQTVNKGEFDVAHISCGEFI